MDTSSAWQTVLGELEVSLSKANFTTWFKNTKLLSANGGQVVIGVPNIFTKEWLENKYHKQIARTRSWYILFASLYSTVSNSQQWSPRGPLRILRCRAR